MASRVEYVREKASGSLEVALSGGLQFSFDSIDAQLLGHRLELEKSRECILFVNTLEFQEGNLIEDDGVLVLKSLHAMHTARIYAMRIASNAEQGSRQLYEKLIKKGYSAELARRTVSWMHELGYVDDIRYIQLLFQAHCVRKGQGFNSIRKRAWTRIGLFNSTQSLFSEAFASIDKNDMMKAIVKCAQNLTKHDASMPRDALSARLKQQGFPATAITSYFETIESNFDQ
jgi:SOS response regulatory protein OraA/RecX